jgi:hypothetical protein
MVKLSDLITLLAKPSGQTQWLKVMGKPSD